MNKKKLLAILLSGAMALSLAACGSDTSNDTTTDTSGDGAATAGNYTVGICQQMQHAALDEATQGFQDKLTELVTAAGGSVEFELDNASGESANAATIVNGFVSSGVALIMANGTTSLQAAQSGTVDIPILGTSITDYATALQMEDWSGTSGTNISGTTDLAPLEDQAQMLLDLFPDAQNVGLLYCSAEPNSVYQVNIVREYLEGQGLTCTDYTFSDSNDLASVTQTACASSDVIYIPTDNTAASYASTIHNVVVPAGVPVITGPCLGDRSKPELVNMTIESPNVLTLQGVQTAICTDHPETPVQYLPLCAAMAVKGGMNPEAALAAITINPARIAGIDSRVGSLAPGKDADVVVTTAHPINLLSRVRLVLINGKPVLE